MTNPTALSGQTFSLGHLLIDYIPGGAITIIHGDQEAVAANDRDGVRHAAELGGYCAAKSPLGIEPLPPMVPKDSLRQPMGGILMTSDQRRFQLDWTRRSWSTLFDSLVRPSNLFTYVNVLCGSHVSCFRYDKHCESTKSMIVYLRP